MDATGDSSASQDIDGALWNANQKLALLLTIPKIVLLRGTSATDEKKTDEPLHAPIWPSWPVLPSWRRL